MSTILVIDDNAPVRKTIARVLRCEGYDPLAVENGPKFGADESIAKPFPPSELIDSASCCLSAAGSERKSDADCDDSRGVCRLARTGDSQRTKCCSTADRSTARPRTPAIRSNARGRSCKDRHRRDAGYSRNVGCGDHLASHSARRGDRAYALGAHNLAIGFADEVSRNLDRVAATMEIIASKCGPVRATTTSTRGRGKSRYCKAP
jgi:hypothetical protein